MGEDVFDIIAISMEPVPVPFALYGGDGDFVEWVADVHGGYGRLLVWGVSETWWVAQDPHLEVSVVCSREPVVTKGAGLLSWWGSGSEKARREVEALAVRYGVELPPWDED